GSAGSDEPCPRRGEPAHRATAPDRGARNQAVGRGGSDRTGAGQASSSVPSRKDGFQARDRAGRPDPPAARGVCAGGWWPPPVRGGYSSCPRVSIEDRRSNVERFGGTILHGAD